MILLVVIICICYIIFYIGEQLLLIHKELQDETRDRISIVIIKLLSGIVVVVVVVVVMPCYSYTQYIYLQITLIFIACTYICI